MPAYLKNFGFFVPERAIDNAHLAARTGKTAEWILNACGIEQRRWADSNVSVADLAVAAAEDCLDGVDRAAVGMLMVSSGSAARGFPGPAAEVARRLGLGQIPALDVPIASAGSLFAMDIARHYAAAGTAVLVVAAEKMSAMVGAEGDGPLDPNIAILFGDGAGAVLISPDTGDWKIVDAVLHSDGQFGEDLKSDGTTLVMNGLSVIMQASRKLPAAIQEVLARQQVPVADLGAILCHQANLNLLTRVAKAVECDPAKMFTNLTRYGNTSSASLLIATAEWMRGAQSSGPLVFAAFGAGLHWGAMLAVRS